ENVLEKGDYPFFVLFMDIDPHKTDVNVHPNKLEVRFDDEKNVYNFVLAIVKKALGTHDLVPSMMFTEAANEREKLRVNNFMRSEREDFTDRPYFESKKTYAKTDFSNKDIDLIFSSITEDIIKPAGIDVKEFPLENISTEILHKPRESSSELLEDSVSFIYQLHNKYILSQIKTGLMIIDQHVAHERILYEKAMKRFENDLSFSQQLLFSRTIENNPATIALVKEIEPYLKKLGFALKFLDKNRVVIEGVPDDIKPGSEEKVLLEIIDEYITNEREKQLEIRDNLAKSYSCKTAIKAGDKLSDSEMKLLIDQLFATSMPYVCPHGRPIVVKISLTEFDRRFGRTS
ncbi:MAG TPA: hypothetical protein VLN45_05300, partial [Ignavibacteriaceae bacterium]|nr:hypothetical protein [Ignavibacteriaceae bacterium]